MDEVKAPVPPDAWQRVWVSYDDEGFFSAPRTEAELRVYFEIAPGLVEQRQEGTTFENWVEECEHYGLLIPQRPDAPFLTLSWSRSDVAEILAGLILPDTDANIDAVISDGQTIDRLRDACTAAGHDVLLDGVERLAEADRLARHRGGRPHLKRRGVKVHQQQRILSFGRRRVYRQFHSWKLQEGDGRCSR